MKPPSSAWTRTRMTHIIFLFTMDLKNMHSHFMSGSGNFPPQVEVLRLVREHRIASDFISELYYHSGHFINFPKFFSKDNKYLRAWNAKFCFKKLNLHQCLVCCIVRLGKGRCSVKSKLRKISRMGINRIWYLFFLQNRIFFKFYISA